MSNRTHARETREQHQAFVATPGDKPIWSDFPDAA
jgi:hypothetical protein